MVKELATDNCLLSIPTMILLRTEGKVVKRERGYRIYKPREIYILENLTIIGNLGNFSPCLYKLSINNL